MAIAKVNGSALSGGLALLFLFVTPQVLASSDSAPKTASDGLLQEGAERPEESVDREQEKESPDVHEQHDTHSYHRHHVVGVVAATTNLDHDQTDFTLGGEYVYRLSPRWGTGGFGEVVFADHREWLLGVPLLFHVNPSFWLRAGLGAQVIPGEQQATTEVKWLVRVGTGYNFEVGGGMMVTPFLDLDLVRHPRALIWGLGIGKGF